MWRVGGNVILVCDGDRMWTGGRRAGLQKDQSQHKPRDHISWERPGLTVHGVLQN